VPCKLKSVLYLKKPLVSTTATLVSVVPADILERVNDPVIEVDPVIWILLPDILVRR
jgi:hypothetical protein